MRKQLVIMMLFPMTLCIWLLGWTLFYIGSQTRQCNRSGQNAPVASCEEIETTLLMEEASH